MKIAILGDSISEGLGSKKYNYVDSLKKSLSENKIQADIKNFALTGTMVSYALEILDQIREFDPDCVLIFYGNVEAILRPDLRKKSLVTSLVPKRYRKAFMLDPRPFYSRSGLKKFGQHLDNAYRFVTRRVVSKLNGTYRFMEPEVFRENYKRLLDELQKTAKTIFCCSNVYLDEGFFPGTSESLEAFRRVIVEVAREKKAEYIPLHEWQKNYTWEELYSKDHYHPSQTGYERMGEYFSQFIIAHQRSTMEKDRPSC